MAAARTRPTSSTCSKAPARSTAWPARRRRRRRSSTTSPPRTARRHLRPARPTKLLIAVHDLEKTYAMEGAPVHALRGVTLAIARGEFVAVVGPSGSGKSTFMHILGCLDRPTSGTYHLDGRDVSRLSDDELSTIRTGQMGSVSRGFTLPPRRWGVETGERPLLCAHQAGGAPADRRARALRALAAVGLADRAGHH